MENNKISSHSEQKSKHSCKPIKVWVFLQHQVSYKIPLNKRKGVKIKLFIDFEIVLKAGRVRNFFLFSEVCKPTNFRQLGSVSYC